MSCDSRGGYLQPCHSQTVCVDQMGSPHPSGPRLTFLNAIIIVVRPRFLPVFYTILSDLQGAWMVFHHSVVDTGGFEKWDRVLFHTDEAMSWETVRNLDRMPSLVLIIRNLCVQSGISGDVMLNLEETADILEETLAQFPK